MSEVEAVVTDLDNTFLYTDIEGHDVIPDSHVEALQVAEDLGVPVLPVTGRSLSLISTVHAAANFRHSAVLDGGASVYDLSTGTYISKRWLPEEKVKEVVEAVKPHATVLACEVDYNPTPASQLDVEGLRGESPSVFAEYEIDKEEMLLRYLGRVASINAVGPMHTSKPGIRCIQVTQPGVDKLSGIQIMLEYEGLQGARLLGIDDNTNGIPLFQAVGDKGITVPMGDAPAALRRYANRPAVGTATQEGFAYALRRYVVEPRKYGFDDRVLRPAMAPNVRDDILAALGEHSLANDKLLNKLALEFRTTRQVDPWEAAKKLARSLQQGAHQLLWGDLDILRPALGIEHASAVHGGLEEDYLPFFHQAPAITRQVARLAAQFGDIGKVLAVATTGQNFQQAEFNPRIAANFLRDMNLPAYAKQAIELLVGQDIIGGLLQGRTGAEEQLVSLRQLWPKELAPYFEDLLLACYLSDASAHSAYRMAVNTRSGRFEPAVQPDDAQLTFLFVRHPSGVVTLTQERGALLAGHLPGLHILRHLLIPNTKPAVAPRPTAAKALAAVVRNKVVKYSRHVTPGLVAGSEELRLTPQTKLPGCPGGQFVHITTNPPESPSMLGPVTIDIPEHDGSTQNTFHIRGGRIWHRAVHYGQPNQRPPARLTPHDTRLAQFITPPSLADTHEDDLVYAALSRVSMGELNEYSDFGAPLDEAAAIRLVKWLRDVTV